MVIDSSAIIACLLDEPERARFIGLIDAAAVRLISVVSFVETSFVILGRKGEAGLSDLAEFVRSAAIESIPANGDQAVLAVEAFRRFGRGRHPARLDIGDCFAYALAKATGEPLLFKGGDFSLTDIVAA